MKYERIQMLRLLAATAVVVFHAQVTALRYLPTGDIYPWLEFGALGVDLFFVISGFIIRMTIEREPTAGFFLRRRVERVVPLYWLCTLAFALLLAFGGVGRGAVDAGAVGQQLVPSLSFLAWTVAPGAKPLIYVGWSLEYEMLFYLATALLLLWTRRPTFALAVLLGGGILIGAVFGAADRGAAQVFFCNPVLIEFLFGLLIADFLLGERPWIAAAITLVVLFTAIPVGGLGDWGGRVWLAGVPGAALVGLAAWLDQRRVAVTAPVRWLARLGDASYSIYLVQVFAISAACKLVVRIAPGLPMAAVIVLTTVATVGVSYVVFLLVERPIQRLTHRFGRLREAQAPSLAADAGDPAQP